MKLLGSILLLLHILGLVISKDAEVSEIDLGDSSALLLKLPIRVKIPETNRGVYNQFNDRERGNQPGEQRLVMRTYNPYAANEEDQEEDVDDREEEDNSEENTSQYGFLPWNRNNQNMILNIKDYFNAKALNNDVQDAHDDHNDDNSESSEWQGGDQFRQPVPINNHPEVRGRNNWRPQEDNDEAEEHDDYRLQWQLKSREPQRRDRDYHRPTNRRRKSKRLTGSGNFEDLRGGVYGTDPVVHFIDRKQYRQLQRQRRYQESSQIQREPQEEKRRVMWYWGRHL